MRLGCVSYLNTLPLIEGLGKLRDARLTLTAPARLIDLLLADEVDIALASLIDYQRSREPLVLIPVGMIGCDGPTLTVRLFSRTPIEQITELHADIDSHTSVALVQIILAKRFGIRPRMVDFDVEARRARSVSGSEWPAAVLEIGDKVVTDAPPAALFPHQLDLGQAWKELTGLPFVYATWMLKRSAFDGASEWVDSLATIAQVLDRQRRHNATRIGWISAQRAPMRGWPVDTARHYLRDLLRFDVTDGHRAAVEKFFDYTHELGLIRERRPTLWADTMPER